MFRVPACFVLASLLFLASFAPAAGKKKSVSPIICSGDQSLILRDRTIHTDLVAVRASGRCDLTLVNCVLVGKSIGLQVTGNASVKLRGSVLQSAGFAVVIGGRGSVVDHGGNQIRGKIRRVSKAAIFRRQASKPGARATQLPPLGTIRGIAKSGRTEFTQRGSVVARRFSALGPPKGVTHRSPIYCAGKQTLVLKKVAIVAKETAAILMGDCQLTLVDSWIHGKRFGIRAMGRAKIVLVRSFVGGRNGGIRLTGSASLSATQSQVKGGVARLGTGAFKDRGGNLLN